MERPHQTFKKTIISAQSIKLLTSKNNPKRSWPEDYLYQVDVIDACGGAESLVLDNVVQYASSELLMVMMAKYDHTRTDYLIQAEELSHFAQSVENIMRSEKAVGKDVVASISDQNLREYTRKCYYVRRLAMQLCCKNRRAKTGKAGVREIFALAVRDSDTIERDKWI